MENQNAISQKLFLKKDFPMTSKVGLFQQAGPGYDVKSVEAFLEDIAVDVEQLENDYATLVQAYRGLSNEAEGTEATDTETMDLREKAEKNLKQTESLKRAYESMFIQAEVRRDKLLEEAQIEKRAILEEAKEKADALIEAAKRYQQKVEQDSHMLISRQEQVKEQLKTVVQYIEEAVS